MKVNIISRERAEELLARDFPKNVAVISFYDPPEKTKKKALLPVDYSGKADRVFMIAIYDIDFEVLEDFGLTYDTYFPEVNALADFIKKANKDGFDIICQCEYGQSRSSGCAAAIREYFYGDGIKIFADYKYYPNQMIFNKLYEALEREDVI